VTVAVIVVAAVFFLGMGVYALAAPAAMIRPFGTELPTAASRSEVRAVYGGFGLAIAAALAGMAFGRIVSVFLDDRTAFYPTWFYCIVEAVAAAALFAVARL
jgi:hypothetical protein